VVPQPIKVILNINIVLLWLGNILQQKTPALGSFYFFCFRATLKLLAIQPALGIIICKGKNTLEGN
jgi:hypothetical protein